MTLFAARQVAVAARGLLYFPCSESLLHVFDCSGLSLGYGHAQRLAQAVADGADAQLVAIDADGNLPEGGWDTLLAAQAIILGAPTYMAAQAWRVPEVRGCSSRPWFSQAWKDKLFAGFTNSASTNGDKQVTLDYLFHLAMQHGGLWVGAGQLPANGKAATRNDVNWLGAFSGAMAQLAFRRLCGRDGSRRPGNRPPAGQRVAAVAARLGA